MNEHWLSDRIMRSQAVTREGLTESQVIAVIRGLADYTLWQKVKWSPDPALEAARFCHKIADDIADSTEVSDDRA